MDCLFTFFIVTKVFGNATDCNFSMYYKSGDGERMPKTTFSKTMFLKKVTMKEFEQNKTERTREKHLRRIKTF